MPQDDLEDMKDAVEIGREHAPPVVLGAIDERVSAAARDAGVGEASVDPAKGERVAANACSIAARSVTSQARASTGAPKPESSAIASPFFRALRPQIETAQPARASALAMPRPMPPLPPVMIATRPERSKSAAIPSRASPWNRSSKKRRPNRRSMERGAIQPAPASPPPGTIDAAEAPQ